MIATKIINRIKEAIFPSQASVMVKKWYAADKDNNLRFEYNLNDKSVVLDLGGYEGQWASDIFSRYLCNVIVFEPVQSFSDRIKKRFKLNNNIEVHQYGLGSFSRAETISICGESSSTLKKKSGAESENIQIIDVKDWIKERNISKIDLIKINIEGGEYELLERLIELNLIELIENIQVQFHDVAMDSTERMEKIQKELMKTHKPTYQYKFIWENWKKKLN
jgi:FkbM family methyltransferase